MSTAEKSPATASPDFRASNHGSIWLFMPLTDAAQEWLDEHCPADDEHQYHGKALAVEARYVESILFHLREEGLII